MKYTGKVWVTVEAESFDEAVEKLVGLADLVKDESGTVIGSLYREEVEEEDDEE